MSSTLVCFLAILVLERFVLYCLGMFGRPIYYCLANRLCFIMFFCKKYIIFLVLCLFFVAITYSNRKVSILEY